jgi:multidrug efflux pump subunit AcrA (membrane-fusion protein)
MRLFLCYISTGYLQNKFMMKKNFKKILSISGIIIAVVGLIVFNRMASDRKVSSIYAEAEEGLFKVTVTAAGELVSEHSTDIMGPTLPSRNNSRGGRHSRMHFRDIKISDMVPEGTVVKKGDFIAQLDRTNFDNTLKDEKENLQNLNSELEMKVLDTAVALTDLRDAIKNQVYNVEEAQIDLDQSKYEPPAIIRQAKIALDEENRKLIQQKKLYKLQAAQQLKEINNIKINIDIQKRTVEDLETYLSGFTILAPSPGMVVYKKNRDGTKRKAGSSLNPWDMAVATLPDLSTMLSKTYISEIEVSKVKPGQEVNIKVDAFPKKAFTGKIVSIARVGEQLPNSDSKMFEVNCRIDGYYPELRPSMTTNNEILIKKVDNAIFVPLECVHTGADGIPFVYTKHKTKQVVVLGLSNEKDVIIKEGLKPGTSIYQYTPSDPENFRLEGQNLITSTEQAPITRGSAGSTN